HEVNNVLSKENISLEQFTKEKDVKENFERNLEKKLSHLDNEVFNLESMSDCYEVYKDSHSLIIGLKSLETKEEKDEYKKGNFQEFKKYDMAKRNMTILRKGYHVNNQDELHEKLNSVVAEDRKSTRLNSSHVSISYA